MLLRKTICVGIGPRNNWERKHISTPHRAKKYVFMRGWTTVLTGKTNEREEANNRRTETANSESQFKSLCRCRMSMVWYILWRRNSRCRIGRLACQRKRSPPQTGSAYVLLWEVVMHDWAIMADFWEVHWHVAGPVRAVQKTRRNKKKKKKNKKTVSDDNVVKLYRSQESVGTCAVQYTTPVTETGLPKIPPHSKVSDIVLKLVNNLHEHQAIPFFKTEATGLPPSECLNCNNHCHHHHLIKKSWLYAMG